MPQNGIQDEIAEMLQRFKTLDESIRLLVTDRRLPEQPRLMEIRATNRELLDIAQKVDRIRNHFLTVYELQPLDSNDSK